MGGQRHVGERETSWTLRNTDTAGKKSRAPFDWKKLGHSEKSSYVVLLEIFSVLTLKSQSSVRKLQAVISGHQQWALITA